LAPNQRVTLSQLGVLSVLGGMMAGLMTASVAGMFVKDMSTLQGSVYEASMPCRVDDQMATCYVASKGVKIKVYEAGETVALRVIETDSLGHFSALLPLGDYKVEAVKVAGADSTIQNFDKVEILHRKAQSLSIQF
jgi:hypothetical protein